MKRLTYLIIISSLLLMLTGCGESDSSNTSAPKPDQKSESTAVEEQNQPADEASEEVPVKELRFEEIAVNPEVVWEHCSFRNGMGLFRYDDKYGYVDEDGKVVIEPKYQYAEQFYGDYAIVSNMDDRLLIIDKNGKETQLSNEYRFLAEGGGGIYGDDQPMNKFIDGVAIVRLSRFETPDGKRGFAAIDVSGKELFRNNDQDYLGIVNGNYMFSSTIYGYFYNKSGNKVAEFPMGGYDAKANGLISYKDGLIVTKKLVDKSHKYGVLDDKGKVVIDHTFEELREPSDGMIAFKKYGKWGFLDYTGKVVIEPSYDEAYWFYNGLGAVKVGHLIGFIDKKNTMVIEPSLDPKYAMAHKYFRFNEDGIAAVSAMPATFVDRKGKITTMPGMMGFNMEESLYSLFADKKTKFYKLVK